jgi:hypothetical protein
LSARLNFDLCVSVGFLNTFLISSRFGMSNMIIRSISVLKIKTKPPNKCLNSLVWRWSTLPLWRKAKQSCAIRDTAG